MKRISGSFVIAGVCAILLSGCVSSKKYKASQSSLSQVRSDSARLAQQVASLDQNVQAMQQKNTDLQASLDKSNSNYASEQKSLQSCQAYFTRQQEAASQLTQELKAKLASDGFTDQDLQQSNNLVYVTIDENNIFRKNSAAVTTKGKQTITDIAGVMQNHSDMTVSVDNGSSASGTVASGPGSMTTPSSGDMSSTNGSMASAPRVHRHHYTHAKSTTASGATASTAKTSSSTANGAVAVHHKPMHRRYSSESGSFTYASKGLPSKERAAWMLKSGRMNTVTRGLLQNGVSKVSIIYSNNTTIGQDHTIKLVVAPAVTDANAPKDVSSTSGAGGSN